MGCTQQRLPVRIINDVMFYLQELKENLISDWAILNHARSQQLSRIFIEAFAWTDLEIQPARHLLEGYHAVCRLNWMQMRAQGYRGKCPPPTAAQLGQISQYLQTNYQRSDSPQQILAQLTIIARGFRNSSGYPSSSLQSAASQSTVGLSVVTKHVTKHVTEHS